MAKSVYQILIEIEGNKNVKNALDEIGKSAGLTGAALTAFSAGAAKLASDYEKTLGDVSIVIDEQTGSTEDLSKAIFQLQEDTKGIINVQQAAEASAELLSSGIKGQTNILNALESSQKAAIAGQSDLNTISSAAAGVVNSYGDALGEGLTQGEKFNKVVDLILRTQIDGVVTADEYARGIGNIASLAADSGVSLEELNGAIALSTEKGTAGSIAINNLKSALSNISTPTAMAREEAKRLGIEFDAARLKSVGLQQVVADIFASENFNEASLGLLFGSQEAKSIITQLGSDLDTLTEKIDNQKNGLGTLDEAYNKVDETVNQRVINSLNLLQGALIQIGTGVLIAVEPVLDIVTSLAQAIAGLPTPVLAVVGGVTALTGVSLTAAGAVLLLATSIGAVQGNLSVGLPILLNTVKGISALAASALSGSISFKSFNLSLLTSNAQLGIMSGAAKKAIVALGPLLTTVALFGGAAASIGAVVDTLNKVDSAAKTNRDSLSDLEQKLLDIKKAAEGTTPGIATEESKVALENLNKELGFLQRGLDKLREGFGATGSGGATTALEAAANRGAIAFGELTTKVNEVEDATRNLIGLDNSAAGLSPEQIKETTNALDASIESLEASTVVSESDILARDAQIARLEKFKATLNGVTEETKDNTSATETQGQTAEEAAKQYEEYAKKVEASVKNIDAATQNSVDSLIGSESFKLQETLRIQEEGVSKQVALLENLRDQEQTSAEDKIKIETEIQTKKVELNKNRIEANKQLEELYNQFLRNSNELSRVNFEQSQLEQNQTFEATLETRKALINETYNTELEILNQRKAEVEAGSAEEKAIVLEIANLKLTKTQDLRALDEQVTTERLAQLERLKAAELDRLNLLTHAQEIQNMMLANSNAVLDSQAGILGKISGLLEGDNATLGQREELLRLAEQITGKTFQTNSESSALDQAQVAIQAELASIELRKLDLKIQQLEIDKESLKIANEIKQLEISGERDAIAEKLRSGNLNQQERQSLQSRDSALAQQSNLENQKTNLGIENIDNQLSFVDFERQLAEILTRNTQSSKAGDLLNTRFEDGSEGVAFRGDPSINRDLLSTEELQEIEDKQRERDERLAEEAKKELEKSAKEAEKTSTNTQNLASTQDQTNTQLTGQTEEIRNVSGSIGSLVEVAQSQLQIQTRMSARLDQISKQLDVLPANIAARLPRPPQPIPQRR
jgi:TP901 family phage tail tape measure protein